MPAASNATRRGSQPHGLRKGHRRWKESHSWRDGKRTINNEMEIDSRAEGRRRKRDGEVDGGESHGGALKLRGARSSSLSLCRIGAAPRTPRRTQTRGRKSRSTVSRRLDEAQDDRAAGLHAKTDRLTAEDGRWGGDCQPVQ